MKRKFTIHCSAALAIVVVSLIGCRKSDKRLPAETGSAQAKSDQVTTSVDRDDPIDQAIAYLLVQRKGDGLWHSPNYGNLRDGAAISSFVLYAISHSPGEKFKPHRKKLQQVCDSLVASVDKAGYVSNKEGPDYSNYATAMLLTASHRMKLKIDDAKREKMLRYLIRSQIGEEHGYQESEDDFGGWDYAGWQIGVRRTVGTNISVTCVVVETLALHRDLSLDGWKEQVDRALGRARKWLNRCHNLDGDGGFFFHPEKKHLGNKAGWFDKESTKVRSYATASCDGIRMLNSLKTDADDPAMIAALNWLGKNVAFEEVPGFEDSEDKTWAMGLRYYYYYALGKSLSVLPKDRQEEIAKRLKATVTGLQRANGRWENENARMREDDPLIATGFALIALAQCERILQDGSPE